MRKKSHPCVQFGSGKKLMSTRRVLAFVSSWPTWLNKFILSLNTRPFLIFGKKYKQVFSSFEKFNDQEFISFFNSNFPSNRFYNERYKILPAVNSLAEFKARVPFIDKDIVLSNFNSIVSVDHKEADLCTTGGTSGKPLKIFLPKSRYGNELGSLHALWSKIGYQFSTRAVVRNERIQEREFLINPITKEFIFDGFRTDQEYLFTIYKTMKKYKIPFFHGYTSNAERFVSFLLDNNLDYGFLRGLITSSENLYPHQKQLFTKLENVQHMNFFGHSEKLILGGWCEQGGCYHFYNSYGYAELVDEAGKDVVATGGVGELVGSTNYNTYMPLFRYRTGDFAEKAPDICPGCGFKGLSVYKIMGRWGGEKIYNKDDSFVTTTSLNLHSEIYDHINALQYYQPEKGIVEVRVVPSSTYNLQVEHSLKNAVCSKFDSETTVSISIVKEVERKNNGKYLLLVSDVCQ